MRSIAYVIGQLGASGTERQLLALVERLDRERFQPHVICLSEDDMLGDSFRRVDCPVHVLSREQLGLARTWLELLFRLRSLRPAIVHAISYAWYLALPAAWVARVPHIVVSERTVPLWKTSRHRLLDRILLRSVDVAIANSNRVRQVFWLDLGLRADRCRVIYNGLDLPTFDAQQQAGFAAPIPDAVESFPAGHVVCAVANLRPDKCLDILIQAHAFICRYHPDVQLWIVGHGRQSADLYGLATKLKIAHRVQFWGFRNDVPAILHKATIGVLSSRTEGCANAVIEYMAAGLPVVATTVGGNIELVVDGETGLLVPPYSPESLANAILHLLDKPALAQEMGRAGRVRAVAQFSMERMVKETEAVYREILSRNGR